MPDHTTEVPQKTCSKCGETKPATSEYFVSNKNCRNGIEGTCKECRNARAQEFADANKERLTEYKHEWYTANKERLNKRNRAYYHANREREIERRRANYLANPQRERESRRKWAIENRELVRQNHLKWRIANRNHLRETQRAYREKWFADPANKEHRREYERNWYQANKERMNEYSRQWRTANKIRVRECEKARRANNPFAFKAYKLRRRALEANAEGFHTAEDIQRQYDAQKGKCYYCKAKVNDTYHVDHVIPLSRGGSNWPTNLVIACVSCNCSKRDKLPHEWSQGGRLL